MNAEIVLTGSEMLLGDLVDTNSVMMARMLRDIGVNLYYKTTVGDNRQRAAEVLSIALKRCDVVLTSGGLGPTVDDVTREAVADATGRPLVYHPELWEQIKTRFGQYGRPVSENNRRQAYAPEGAILVENRAGTAPAFIVETDTCSVISLPGVPRELQYLMENVVVPYLQQRLGERAVIVGKVLRTCAVGESRIDTIIGDLMTGNNPTVGLLAHSGQVDVRITAKADTRGAAEALISPVEADVRARLGAAVYGEADQTLDEVIDGLLASSGNGLAIVDTVTSGEMERMLPLCKQNGHLVAYHPFLDMEEAGRVLGVATAEGSASLEHVARAAAGSICRESGASICLVIWGQVAGLGEIGVQRVVADAALVGGETVFFKHFDFRTQGDLALRWLSIRTLDLVRRYLIGALETATGVSMAETRLAWEVGALLSEQGLSLAVAESCTGGLLGDRITDVPGSSEYFMGGAITYSYEAKERVLGVRHETLINHGAVSQQTALEMAAGVRQLVATDIGLAITGIAGPGGGMPEKPVGLVYMALHGPDMQIYRRLVATGDRLENKAQFAEAALGLLRDYLIERRSTAIHLT